MKEAMQELAELAVWLVIVLATLAAPFVLGIAFHAVAAGTFGIGFMAGLGFFPALLWVADKLDLI